jgi:hypothetical protein
MSVQDDGDTMDSRNDPQYELLYPYTVCRSQGGPFDDEAFVAGVQLGQIDEALQVAAIGGVERLSFTAYTALVRQLELCGMARGFPVVSAEAIEETDEYPAMPDWSVVTFARSGLST